MTISRVKAPGWGANEIATSAQLTSLDTKLVTALDKTSAGDTLAGVIQMSGVGRIVPTVSIGTNFDSSYTVGGGNNVIRVTSGISANRSYTLSATGAVTGDIVYVYCETGFTHEIAMLDQAAALLYTLGNQGTSDGQWASFMYIGGWRLFQGGQGSRYRTQTFTAGGTWTCPAGVTTAILVGVGGGGGGASGWFGAASPQSANSGSGGGGGGGALLGSLVVTVVPTTGYVVVIGAGGTGGAGAFATNPGGDGTDTTFGSLAAFAGGQGGQAGMRTTNTAALEPVSFGGAATRGAPRNNTPLTPPLVSALQAVPASGPQCGGAGHWHSGGSAGALGNGGSAAAANSSTLYAGGNFINMGVDSSPYNGGGGGGGGGAGPYGVGAGAGAGGAANNGGAGANGSVGASAAVNTGAGGGGGGAGGYGSASNGQAGAGGNGGSGQLTVIWVK